jgi:hypothetical protein
VKRHHLGAPNEDALTFYRHVLDGPLEGDVVQGYHPWVYDTIRLLRWVDPLDTVDTGDWHGLSYREVVLYYRVTCALQTSEHTYVIVAYSSRPQRPSKHIAELAIRAEALLTS